MEEVRFFFQYQISSEDAGEDTFDLYLDDVADFLVYEHMVFVFCFGRALGRAFSCGHEYSQECFFFTFYRSQCILLDGRIADE